MTVANNYAPIVTAATGSVVQYSGTWNAISAAYLVVQLQNVATNVYTTVTQGTGPSQYQVISLTASGFVIQFNTAPVTGNNVIISRNTTAEQEIPYTTSRGFQGPTEEGSFDALTTMVQELIEASDRALKFNVGSPSLGSVPEPIDGYGLVWDGTAGTLRNTDASLAVLETNAATVAANISAINSVAGDLTNINSVAADLTPINTVATNITNVNAVGVSITNVNNVAGDLTNINSVAGDLTNINTVATNISNVNIVAGISSNVTTVATDVTNINNVAADLTNINTCAANIAAINAAPAAAAAAQAAVIATANEWNFASSTVMADPGTGNFRLDNASLGSVANIALSSLTGDSGNPNIHGYLVTWGNSNHNPRGIIKLAKNSTNFVLLGVTGNVADGTTWVQIPVSVVAAVGSFSAADAVEISFTPYGNDGTGSGDFSTNTTSSASGELVEFVNAGGKTGGRSFIILSGPASSAKTFGLPNASANILTDNAAVTVAQGGTGAASITANSVVLGNGASALNGNLVAPGTSGNLLTSNGTTWQSSPAAGGAQQLRTTVITSSGSFTTPSNITTSTIFNIYMVGAGGGTGGTTNNGAGSISNGGGAGEEAFFQVTGLNPSTAYTCTIGAGGTAGAITPTAGGTGGTTSIVINSTTYSCVGGSGSAGANNSITATPTAGGTGGAGTALLRRQGQFGTVATSGASSGKGGDSFTGYGTGGAAIAATAIGNAGGNYGAGAGGSFGVTVNRIGAVGSAGMIQIEYVA